MAADRRRWLAAAVASAAAVAIAVGSSLIGGSGGSDRSETRRVTDTTGSAPSGFPTPDQADVDADLAWLAGDGRALAVMHERARALLLGDLFEVRCSQEASSLDTDAPADAVLDAAGGLRDPVLRAALLQERTSLGLTLSACIGGDQAALDAGQAGLGAAAANVDVRLADLQAAS